MAPSLVEKVDRGAGQGEVSTPPVERPAAWEKD
jgi:hypothetical protein